MKKQITLFLVLIVFLTVLGGCRAKYRPEDFIGKTSAQIEAEYGAFDCINWDRDPDGLYRNTDCGYTLKEPQVGFLGTDPEWLVFIRFDQNGVACHVYEGYRPGG